MKADLGKYRDPEVRTPVTALKAAYDEYLKQLEQFFEDVDAGRHADILPVRIAKAQAQNSLADLTEILRKRKPLPRASVFPQDETGELAEEKAELLEEINLRDLTNEQLDNVLRELELLDLDFGDENAKRT